MTENAENKKTSPKRPPLWLRRIFTFLKVTFLSFFLLLIAILLLVTVLFPNNWVREQIEQQAAKATDGELHIESLSFNLLYGLTLKGIHFQKDDDPILTLDQVILDYDLTALPQGRFVLNSVLLDATTLNLNLPKLAKQFPPSNVPKKPKPKSPSTTRVPLIPIDIDLKSIAVHQLNLQMQLDKESRIKVENLNLDISAKLEHQQAQLKAVLKIAIVKTNNPAFESLLDRLQLNIDIHRLSIKENLPIWDEANLSIQLNQATYQAYQLDKLFMNLKSQYQENGQVNADLMFTAIPMLPEQKKFEFNAMPLPLRLDINASGNVLAKKGDLSSLTFSAGDLLSLKANAKVSRTPSDISNDPDDFSLSVSADLAPHLDRMLAMIPPALYQTILKGIKIDKEQKDDHIIVHIKALTDHKFQPKRAKLSSEIQFKGISTQMANSQNKSLLKASVEDLSLGLDADYLAKSGEFKGVFSTDLTLNNLQQTPKASIRQLSTGLNSQFYGVLNHDFKPVSLHSSEKLNMVLSNIRYQDSMLNVKLPTLTLAANTQNNILDQHVNLTSLTLNAGSLFDLSAAADFKMKEQAFKAKTHLNYLDLDKLRQLIAADKLEEFDLERLQGKIELAANTSGVIPTPEQIKAIQLPISADALLSFHAIQATALKQKIKDFEGDIRVSYQPKGRVATLNTNLAINRVLLADDLPLKRLTGGVLNTQIKVNDFNELLINKLLVGIDGAHVSASGALSGFQSLLNPPKSSKAPAIDLASLMPTLFARLATKVNIELPAFQPIFKQLAMVVSGSAAVGFNLSKLEKGPIDVQLTTDTDHIFVDKGTTQLSNLSGGFSLRKHLDWKAASSRTANFTPSDIVNTLGSISHNQKSFRIDQLQVGLISLTHLFANIFFDGQSFKVQNLAVNLLGGGLGGNISFRMGKGFGLKTDVNIISIDLNQLLDDNLKVNGDSRLDATLGLAVLFDEEKGKLDLSRTELNLFITHIGKDVLDRLLVFLDPQGINPTLVGARAQIRLANPGNVSLTLSHGLLNMDIHFSQGLVPDISIRRIAVGKLRPVRKLTKAIPEWDKITRAIYQLGARSYTMDKNGKIQLK